MKDRRDVLGGGVDEEFPHVTDVCRTRGTHTGELRFGAKVILYI